MELNRPAENVSTYVGNCFDRLSDSLRIASLKLRMLVPRSCSWGRNKRLGMPISNGLAFIPHTR
jgi:hypothetical protein